MRIKAMAVGPLAANCYILSDEKNNSAAIIDPGSEPEKILSHIKREGLVVKWIILTHGHMDHIGAVEEIKEATKAKIAIHERDRDMLTSGEKNLSSLMGRSIVAPPADRLLKDGDTISVGALQLEILHTPGHTPGGICIRVGDVLFTGDTLFKGSVGRSDLPDGSHAQLVKSIKDKLLSLSEHITVYPGHGPKTTLGEEKNTNPFL